LTNDADLIIADGDDFIPDILGIGTDVDTPGILADGQGKLRVDNITNKTGTKAPKFPYGLAVPVGAAVSIGVATEGKPGLVGIDTTTGIFFPTTGEVAITAGGTEALRVDTSGNIGIGTDNPNHLLTLEQEGTGNFDALNFRNGSTNVNGYQMGINPTGDIVHWNTSNSDIIVASNNTERLRISSGGQIQVGAGNTLLLGDSSPTNNTVYNYENVGNGLIRKYYVTDSLDTAQDTRFTFNGPSGSSALIQIKAVGSWTSSDTATNHPAGIFSARLFTNTSGDTTDSSSVNLEFGYGYQAADWTFTNGGSNSYTIDIENPTDDDGVTFSYEVTIFNAVPGSQHTLTASSTV